MKETFGNVPTDSSDDTYGSDSIDSSDDRGRGRSTRKGSPKNPVPALSRNGTDDLKNIKTKCSSKRTRQKPAAENMDNSVTKTPEGTLKSSSSVRRTTSSSHRRLSQPTLEVILLLLSSFFFAALFWFQNIILNKMLFSCTVLFELGFPFSFMYLFFSPLFSSLLLGGVGK